MSMNYRRVTYKFHLIPRQNKEVFQNLLARIVGQLNRVLENISSQ